MVAAIHLQHHAGSWSPFSPGAMLRTPVALWAVDTRFQQDAPDGRAGDHDLLNAPQLLCEMCLVEATIFGLSQLNDALAYLWRQGLDWHPPTVSVNDSIRSLLAEGCEETPYLTLSDTQALGCFHRCHAMGIKITHNRVTLLAFQIDLRCVF
jgi:hypothetical protein